LGKKLQSKKEKKSGSEKSGGVHGHASLAQLFHVPLVYSIESLSRASRTGKLQEPAFINFFFEIRASFYIRALPAISHHQTSPLVREELHHSSI
jgi:hypothetical protein